MSVRSCCIPQCGKTRSDNIVLHAFPNPEKEKERFLSWVNAVGSSLASLDSQYIYRNRKICHDHFENRYLTWTRKLSYNAVPTLRIPDVPHQRTEGVIPTDPQLVEQSEESFGKDVPQQRTEDVIPTDPQLVEQSEESFGKDVPHQRTEGVIPTDPQLVEQSEESFGKDVPQQRTEDVIPTDPQLVEQSEESFGEDVSHERTENVIPMNPKLVPKDVELRRQIQIHPKLVKQSRKSVSKGTIFYGNEASLLRMLKKEVKKKENYATRLKKALKLSENETFKNTLDKFTSLAAIFIAMQFREISKNKMGRRFTEKEKIMALSIYKQGPKCYRMLSKIFVLPSPLTLSRLVTRADLRAGINEKLFNVMLKKIKKFKPDDKLCILMFDEMAICPHFEYNQRKDEISGFVTNGSIRENKIADHALVFMIRGVLRNYKQPVAYTFCSGSTKKDELAMLITTVIRKLRSVGLQVLATVCDQGAANVSCINHLIHKTKEKYLREGREIRRGIFEIDNEEVIPLYDPPHLIKGIRNNLLDKNLQCTINGTTKVAKWEHVIKLHEENPSYSGIKLIKNLTEDHINPEKCKMKVKLATQIFSQKVASTMGYLADKNILPKECQQTADVFIFFDELFDSFNGSQINSRKRSGKPLLSMLTPKSPHNKTWANAKQILKSMNYIKNNKEITVPSIRNWLHTVNNVEYLRDVLFEKHNIKSIWMRHFNQDPLENFFGSIRSHGLRNINPTPAGFEVAFASLLINNLTGIHSPGSNCERDNCNKMFKSTKELFKKVKKTVITQDIDLSYLYEDTISVDFNFKKENPVIWGQLQYVTGYLLKKTKMSVFTSCVTCKRIFYSTQQKNREYINAREFNKLKTRLIYPSDDAIEMFSKIQDILMWVLKRKSKIENLKIFAKTILYTDINTNFINCEKHKKDSVEYIFDLACRFFIFNWCKDVNNILKGRRKEKSQEDTVQSLALDYVRKRRKINTN